MESIKKILFGLVLSLLISLGVYACMDMLNPQKQLTTEAQETTK